MNREEARELLPWFAVDALESEESRLVAAHLEDSAELRAELVEIRGLVCRMRHSRGLAAGPGILLFAIARGTNRVTE